jgi:type II secretory pathway pseudopilin PulG
MKQNVVSSQAGVSFVEVVVSVAIILTLGAAAFIVMPGFVKTARADGASQAAVNSLRVARERALGERRNFEVRFTGSKRIEIYRREVPSNANTEVMNLYLENDQQWYRFPGLPDTPDAFGVGSGPINFGGSAELWFTSEGTFVDQSGDVLNGTVIFGNPSDKTTARAITIFGATGLLRVWKWNGRQWVE